MEEVSQIIISEEHVTGLVIFGEEKETLSEFMLTISKYLRQSR